MKNMDQAKHVFLDANVLLEVVHQRRHQAKAVEVIMANRGNLYVSMLTVHLVMYFGSKIASKKALYDLLSDYELLPLTADDFEWAYMNARNDDFEDALQVAVAVRAGCTDFITFDKILVASYEQLPRLTMTRLVG